MSTSDCSKTTSSMFYGYPTPCSSPSDQIEDPISSQTLDTVIRKIDATQYCNEGDLVSDICQSLRVSGGCIIKNLVDKRVLDALEGEIRPYLNKVEKADAQREEFVPSSTRMVTGLLSKSKTYALNIAGNSIWQKVGERFLTTTMRNYWHGDKARTSTSLPQLSTTVTFSVRPGTKAQSLHRDDDIYHTYHPAAREHHDGRDTMVCLFVAGTKTRRENGATRIIPGSHLWDYSQPPPSSEDPSIQCAELDPGDAFMMLGGCFHGAGANTTADEERLVYAAFSTRGYLRQEENQYLANDIEKIKELPISIQRYAGFGVSKPFMGWVDMEDPVRSMNPNAVDDLEDDFW